MRYRLPGNSGLKSFRSRARHHDIRRRLGWGTATDEARKVYNAFRDAGGEHRRTRFEWQEGYFAASVSRSQIPTLRRYVARQKEHHKKMSSEREFLVLLKKHGLEWHD